MFERLKKVFIQSDATPMQIAVPDAVSKWAGIKGFTFAGVGEEKGFVVTGKAGNKPWKLERGKSTRDYILGDELRARAELKLNDDVAVLIINRSLK